jgi:hypothetical protein
MKYEYKKKILEFAQIQCQKEIDFLGFGKQGSLGSIAPELLAVTDQMVNLAIALRNEVTQLIQLVANQVEMMASPLDFGERKNKIVRGLFPGRCCVDVVACQCGILF